MSYHTGGRGSVRNFVLTSNRKVTRVIKTRALKLQEPKHVISGKAIVKIVQIHSYDEMSPDTFPSRNVSRYISAMNCV